MRPIAEQERRRLADGDLRLQLVYRSLEHETGFALGLTNVRIAIVRTRAGETLKLTVKNELTDKDNEDRGRRRGERAPRRASLGGPPPRSSATARAAAACRRR